MPSFKTEGKSKEDLALVTQLSGLLSPEDSARMTRTQLVRILEAENRKSEKIEQQMVNESAGRGPAADIRKPARGRKPAAPAAPVSLTTAAAPAAPAQPVKRRRPIERMPVLASVTAQPDGDGKTISRPRKAARQAVIPVTAVGVAPGPVAAPAITDKKPESVAIGQPKGRPARITTRKTNAGKSTAEMAVAVQAAQTISDPTVELSEQLPATAAADIPAVKRPAGRRPNQKAAMILADDVARIQEMDFVQPVSAESASPTQTEIGAADRSPEAAEAAADKDQSGDRQDPHRVPPHHTLTQVKPGQRRTTRIIGSQPTGSSASQTQQTPPLHRSNQQQQQQPQRSRPQGRPTRQSQAAAAVSAANRSEFEFAAEAERSSFDLSDAQYEGLADPAAEFAGSHATIVPIQAGLETGNEHHPAVEAGDVQSGILEIMPDGYGFLRKENYLQGNKDIYVPPQYIRRFGLRPGDHVTGPVKLQRENDRFQALLYIKDVNGLSPEKMLRRPHFDRLTPIYPDDRFILETVRNELSTRIIDLVAPIGKGQRGMIVSPPKAGKTILLQKIANAISINNPEVKLIVLLIDERPEEVTDMQRSINGEVVYSTFDKMPENHTKVTELVLERAMRLVELKHDVVILLDSMTRLARAYNLSINPTGRTLSGGLDPGALYGPKRFFGAARNIENGGSLTIIATSLIETGSRMDEVIFEEFKGTGNMEVYLDRKMSEKRIFPAIDINKSGTRREELLMTSKELDAVWTIRKAFGQLDSTAVTEAIINLLLKTTSNEHFIASVNVSFNDKNVFEAMRGVRPSDNSQGTQPGRGTSGGYGGYNSSGSTSNYRRSNGSDDD